LRTYASAEASDRPVLRTRAAGRRSSLRDRPPARYRPSVGICLLNDRGEVFQACRTDMPDKGDDGCFQGRSAWQMPQGGLEEHMGELDDPLAAARRELWEETGVTSAELVAEMDEWLTYDFPKELLNRWLAQGRGWGGRYKGQAQRWFVFRYTGDAPMDSEVDLGASGDPEFDEWRMAPLDRLAPTVVAHKREVYTRVASFAKQCIEDEAYLGMGGGGGGRKWGDGGHAR